MRSPGDVTEFYAENDPYTFPGLPVLRNKLGITDQAALETAERVHSARRLLEAASPPPTFDYTHLRALHFHMFQDVFDWAGMERTVSIQKGDSLFAAPRFLSRHGRQCMEALRSGVQTSGSFDACVAILGHFVLEMNALHPFREGNGRVLREFLNRLVSALNWGMNVGAMRKDRWIEACIAGFRGDEAPMTGLMADLVIPTARCTFPPSWPRLEPGQRAKYCAFLRRYGCPEAVKTEYRATLRC